MPLQGKLSQRRHFQALSPFDMIKATLDAEPERHIIATLHPKERYSAADLARLATIGERFHLSDQPSIELLAGCDMVVTENSSMGLLGYFAAKPLVLFARTDFHHIAGSVPRLGIKAAFEAAHQPQPFARYLYWFFKEQAVSEIAVHACDQIRARFQHHGWPIQI